MLNAVVKSEPSDEQLVSSNDDSDDDSDQDSDLQCFRPKKLKKVKREKLCKPIAAPKSNKYNVWSIGLQEEALTATLEKCDVESMDRSRDVESYNYKFKYYDSDDRTTAGISDQLSEVSVKKEIKRYVILVMILPQLLYCYCSYSLFRLVTILCVKYKQCFCHFLGIPIFFFLLSILLCYCC